MATTLGGGTKNAKRNAKEKIMISESIHSINTTLPLGTKLVAVSKFHSPEAIMQAYNCGQRVFGESRPQEFNAKVLQLPKDIKWHFIGHLQTNKLKLVLPYAHLIESVDSIRLLNAINLWGSTNNKVINILLELHLGAELTKTGLTKTEIEIILNNADQYKNIVFCGLMGMATNTDNEDIIRQDFKNISNFKKELNNKFPQLKYFKELSIGMSMDYKIAIEYGATLVRIGTAIFGHREY